MNNHYRFTAALLLLYYCFNTVLLRLYYASRLETSHFQTPPPALSVLEKKNTVMSLISFSGRLPPPAVAANAPALMLSSKLGTRNMA